MNITPLFPVSLALIAAFSLSSSAAQHAVDLGAAGKFVILTKTGITTTGTTAIVGDIGVSPIDSTAMTGFSLTLSASGAFATSPFLTGQAFASDYGPPTPAYMTAVIGDMELAYEDASGRIDGNAVTELGAGNVGGMTLAPGLYKWGTGLLIDADVTLSGSSCGVWIFQIAENLTIENGVKILLSGGALNSNIFWQVSGEASIGTTAHVEGTILSKTAIHLRTGASANGALFAQTAVTLDANAVTIPSTQDDSAMVWFGAFTEYYKTGNGDAWLDHAEHGWLYKIQALSGVWLWDEIQQAWLWTDACTYPFLYNNKEHTWVFYNRGGTPAGRWFYFLDNQNQNSGEWRWIF